MRDWEMTDPICWMERLRPNAPNVAGFIWAQTEHLAGHGYTLLLSTTSTFWECCDSLKNCGDVFSERQISDFLLLHPVKFSNKSEHSVLIRWINEHAALRELMHRHWWSVWSACFQFQQEFPLRSWWCLHAELSLNHGERLEYCESY